MPPDSNNSICTRRLRFTDASECAQAATVLAGDDAVTLERAGDDRLEISFDVTRTSLASVDARLAAAGLRRLAFTGGRFGEMAARYFEFVQRDLAEGNPGFSGAVRTAYIAWYRARPHGRRDDRKQQWRSYLNREQ